MQEFDKTEGDYQYDLIRGQRAEQLLADPIIDEAFTKVEQELKEKVLGQFPTADRQTAWEMLHSFYLVKKQITDIIMTGRLADVSNHA